MSLSHQDWEPVVLGKKTKKRATPYRPAAAPATRPGGGGGNPSAFGHGPMGTTATNAAALARETETFRPERVQLAVSRAIQQSRVGAGLTQKQLAQRINVRPAVVQAYENGSAAPNGRVVQRIERALGLAFGAISGRKRRKKKNKKGAREGGR